MCPYESQSPLKNYLNISDKLQLNKPLNSTPLFKYISLVKHKYKFKLSPWPWIYYEMNGIHLGWKKGWKVALSFFYSTKTTRVRLICVRIFLLISGVWNSICFLYQDCRKQACVAKESYKRYLHYYKINNIYISKMQILTKSRKIYSRKKQRFFSHQESCVHEMRA